MSNYENQVFHPIDIDGTLERIAGGNETEVYRTDDRRFVVKLKADLGSTRTSAMADARLMRAAAEFYAECLGPRYTIPSMYLVAEDDLGRAQVLVVQPFLEGARALHDLDYHALPAEDRELLALQLRDIISRSLAFFRRTGSMPDLYGRSSASVAERHQSRGVRQIPRRLWSFLVERNLLRSHNLMLAADGRVVLVDYDFVRRGRLYRSIYYGVRLALFARDHAIIATMRNIGSVPRGSARR